MNETKYISDTCLSTRTIGDSVLGEYLHTKVAQLVIRFQYELQRHTLRKPKFRNLKLFSSSLNIELQRSGKEKRDPGKGSEDVTSLARFDADLL